MKLKVYVNMKALLKIFCSFSQIWNRLKGAFKASIEQVAIDWKSDRNTSDPMLRCIHRLQVKEELDANYRIKRAVIVTGNSLVI